MSSSTAKSVFWKGFADGVPFLLVLWPFGMLFGVVAATTGLDLIQTMAMTALVLAGASQFAALQMLSDNAGILLIILASLAVNLRMAMYSAALAQHFGPLSLWRRAFVAYLMVDQNFAAAQARFEANPGMSVSDKMSYFLGITAPIFPNWLLATFVGAWLGAAVPKEAALDFAMPITFIALIAPMLRTVPHVAAAVTSVVMALMLTGLPSGLAPIVAGVVAMSVGALAETLMARTSS